MLSFLLLGICPRCYNDANHDNQCSTRPRSMDTSQEAITVDYAGFWIRLAAYLIDFVLLSLVMFIIVVVSGSYLEDSTGPNQPIVPIAVETGTADRAITAIGNILPIVYAIGFWTWRGQTPGKMALGIKIVRTDGYPIGFARSILRYVGYIISGLMLMLGYVWIAFDPKKQGIHDKIARTYVVRLPQKTARRIQIYE